MGKFFVTSYLYTMYFQLNKKNHHSNTKAIFRHFTSSFMILPCKKKFNFTEYRYILVSINVPCLKKVELSNNVCFASISWLWVVSLICSSSLINEKKNICALILPFFFYNIILTSANLQHFKTSSHNLFLKEWANIYLFYPIH